ncbi:cysteine--tRNA ligase [Candidatus Woesearchaeota archaeon]|nr:cysteine--tRNA ligase [Candidatus Woesearchaeota archaeon]
MLKLYNTLTRKLEEFKPITTGKVSMYSCGPTVYDFAHIGNFRAYLAADLLKRYLKYSGYGVKHVMNLTDVDDKTIAGAKKKGISLAQFTQKYAAEFFKDIKALNIDTPDEFPKATEHIREMVNIIHALAKSGTAYQGEDKSWYFNIRKFPGYGKLSHSDFSGLQMTERIKKDSYEKEQAQDFALWKAYTPEDGDVFWETSLGKGRPGWHIECSAMSMKHLGKHFDIHTGGVDLIFPHHENEIAQSEASTGMPFVNTWAHNEHLLVDGRKMSKSLGNFYTLRDILAKGFPAPAVRYLLLSVHYRQQLNFTFAGLTAAQQAVEKINNFIFVVNHASTEGSSPEASQAIQKCRTNIKIHLDEDLNISEALADLFGFMSEINKITIGKKDGEAIISWMESLDKILGLMDFTKQSIGEEALALIHERDSARSSKDWKKADALREKLIKQGVELFDTDQGTIWKVRK